MNTRTRKVRRRARLAMAVLAGALVLPGLVAADHFECEPGSTSNACGKFDPQMIAGAQVPFTDTPSSVSFRFNQKDQGTHDQPVLGVSYLIPKGWQFAVNSLRPAQVSEGANIGDPATSCNQVIVGEENDNDDAAATLGRAENLAGGVGALVNTKFMRDFGPGPIEFGYKRNSPSEFNGDITTRNPSFSFLGYDSVAGVANLCLYWYANTFNLAEEGFDPIFAFDHNFFDFENEEAREHIIPLTLRKVQPGELNAQGEDLSLSFGWRMDYDLTSFYGHEWLKDNQEALVLDALTYIDAISGGNWNINDTTGSKESIVFSKTPKVAGNYEFRGVFTTCAEGFNNVTASTTEAAEALAPSALCKNGALLETTRSVFQKILNPPNANVLSFGQLTGPAGVLPQTGTAGTPRFGLVRGTNQVTFTWTQPTLPVEEQIKGYLLTIARPGDQDGRHFEYMITNDADLGFDTREPCGAAGDATTCSLTLTFPLNTVGSDPLDVNGKYDAALITLYEGTNGSADRRSDGLCDDGTGIGMDCPLTDPAFRIDIHRAFDMNRVPGISTWQFMLRDKAWPIAYLTTASVTRSGGGPTFNAPLNVLFVDFALRQGELSIWNALGFEERYFAPSNLIQGDNSLGGVVEFGSTAMTGHTKNWLFAGRILPAGGGASALGVGTFRASGQFLQWDLKGLPGAVPPGGLPFVHHVPFQSNTPV